MELLLLLLQLALLVMIVAIRRNRRVSPYLPTLLLFMTLLWFVIPVVLTVLLQGKLETYSFVNYDVFLFYAVLESFTLLVTLAFLLTPKPYFKFIIDSRLADIYITPKGALLVVISGIGFTILTVALVALFIGTSYWDLNAFTYLSEGTDTFNNMGSVVVVQTLLSCFCCACFIYTWPRERNTWWLLGALMVWVFIMVASQAPSGARMSLLQPLFLLTLYCQAQPWSSRRKLAIIGMGGVSTVVVGSILAVAIGQARYGDRLNLGEIVSSSSKAAEQNLISELANNLITKFDSFSTGALLVERMGAGSAGIQPYVGAVLALVPRAVLPSKPIPGSFDGTIRGHPTRVVAVQMGMSEEAGNVNLSPAAVSIWQFGYLGLAVMIVCNVLQLYLINSLLLSPSLFLKSLAFFLVGLPSLLTLYASPDFLLMNLERILLFFLLLFAIYYALQRRLLRQQPWQQANTHNQ